MYMILFNPHLIPLLPSAGKPAVPANRRLERSDRIGGVPCHRQGGVVCLFPCLRQVGFCLFSCHSSLVTRIHTLKQSHKSLPDDPEIIV
jgi:hypothetical protein